MEEVLEQLLRSPSPSPGAAGASTTSSGSGASAASGRSSVAAAARTDVSSMASPILQDKEAREFWTKYFPDQSSVLWAPFSAALAHRFRLEQSQLGHVRPKMDIEKNGCISQEEFDIFGRDGLQEAIEKVLAMECVVCYGEFVDLSNGILCQGSSGARSADEETQHFICQGCLSRHVQVACENGGAFEERDDSPAGSIPCCMFPHRCNDGALDEGLMFAAFTEEARESFLRARGRLDVEKYRKEEEERQRIFEEQQARQKKDLAYQARLCVIEALTIGQAIKCPGCKNPKRKDDACMHMDCDCGVHFCYACGADRYPGVLGRGERYRPENKVDCGCDATSIYLQSQPGWSNFAQGNERPATGALNEFHRRRMAYFVGVVKRAIEPDVWGDLRETYPHLLQDVIARRSIQWDEVDTAEHPKFGARAESTLIQDEERQLQIFVESKLDTSSN